MKLINQVCTLEQAKRLKELGVRQDAIWFWAYPVKDKMISTRKGVIHYTTKEDILMDNEGDEFDHDVAAAFTVAELCQMLPDYYPSWRFKVSESSEERKWIATVICGPKPPGIDNIHTAYEFDRYAKTQAEALATLLIALLDIKYITPEEVNARLCAD